MELALGTVQFGIVYGVANTKGKTSAKVAQSIMQMARDSEINTIDTAIAYGDSESILGDIGVKDCNIVTKLGSIPEELKSDSMVKQWINDSIEASLKRLNRKHIDTLLLHQPDELFGQWGKVLIQTLLEIQNSKLVHKLGVSVYNEKKLDTLCGIMNFQVVQCPLNIFDRRFELSGVIARLAQNEIQVHVRSSFLQGLLLMKSSQRPVYFKNWMRELNQWDTWLVDNESEPLDACLSYIKSVNGVSHVVVGVESAMQFKQIIQSFIREKGIHPGFHFSDKNQLINPALWRLN